MVISGNCSFYDLQSAYKKQQETMGKTHDIFKTPETQRDSGSISSECSSSQNSGQEVRYNCLDHQGHEG